MGTPALSVTVVMPNFNHARFLRASVGALLSQNRPADKIFIFDDASTDHSLALLRELAAVDSRIELIAREKNIGVAANLNDGLARCETELIVFAGADDLVFPDFLQRSVPLLEQNPHAAFVAAAAQIRDENDHTTGARPLIYPRLTQGFVSAEDYKKLLRHSDNHFLSAVMVYRVDKLREIGGFDAALGPLCDGLLARRLAARHGFCFIPRQLGVWRNFGTNYSTAQSIDPARLEQLIGKMQTTIRNEPADLFDKTYAERLAQRMRFNGARLRIVQSGMERLILLLQAYCRFRPFSFATLMKQRLVRLFLFS